MDFRSSASRSSNDEDGVVTRYGSQHPGWGGAIDCRCNRRCTSRRRFHHDQVQRTLNFPGKFLHSPTKLSGSRPRLQITEVVPGLAARRRHLLCPDGGQVSGNGGLSDFVSSFSQQVHQLFLTRHLALLEQAAQNQATSRGAISVHCFVLFIRICA